MDAINKIYEYRKKLNKKYKIVHEEKEEIREVGRNVSCLFCGKEFEVQKDTKGLFCSRQCSLDNSKKVVSRPCPICGKIFTVPYYRRRVKYCSKECSIKASAIIRTGQKRTDELKQKISDTQKEVWEKRRRGELPKINKRFYQSDEWKKAQSERIKNMYADGKIRMPQQKIFKEDEELIIEYYLDFNSTPKIAEMMNVSKSAILRCLERNHIPCRPNKGEFHPQWKGGRYRDGKKNYGSNWHERKKEVLVRDGCTCQLCGNKDRLEVHHIIPIRLFSIEAKETEGNDFNNLITLCIACHRIEHELLRKEV